MPNILKLAEKQEENIRWPLDCILEKLDEYDEVLVIARKKGHNCFTKFHSRLGDTYWWIGVLETVKILLSTTNIIKDESD